MHELNSVLPPDREFSTGAPWLGNSGRYRRDGEATRPVVRSALRRLRPDRWSSGGGS